MIAFDTETHLIQPGLLAPPIVATGFYDDVGLATLLPPISGLDHLRKILYSGELIVGASIAYDMVCALAARPELLRPIFRAYEEGRIFDVLIAQSLDSIAKGYFREGFIIDPRTGQNIKHPITGKMSNRYNLAIVADLVLGEKDAKALADDWTEKFHTLDGIPISEWPKGARDYLISDVRVTYQIADKQLETHENMHCMRDQVRAALALQLSSVWGIKTDPTKVAAFEREVMAAVEKDREKYLNAGLLKHGGKNGVQKDTKAVADRVSKAYGGNPPRTATGRVSADRDTLSGSGDDLLEEFGESTKTEKLVTTYLPFLKAGTVAPLNLSPNVLLATGRNSYDGLIQLLPRKGGVRECFRARDGYLISSVDWNAGELTTLAQTCLEVVGWSKLAAAINEKKDPHTLFAAVVYGQPYNDEFLKLCKTDPVWKDRRQMMKKANFGFGGMMGAAKFAIAQRKDPDGETRSPTHDITYRGLRLCIAGGLDTICGRKMIVEWKGRECPPVCEKCVEQAEWLRNRWFEMWPEMKPYFNWVMAQLDLGDRIEQTPDRMIRGGLTPAAGANTSFQHKLAVALKLAMWEITRKAYLDENSKLFGSRILVAAHDETLMEVPESRAADAAYQQAWYMDEALQRVCPDVRFRRSEAALMRYWYKNAEPVYVDGRLVAWEPGKKAA